MILISGSGAQDRDESIPPLVEIKPFALIADHLTRNGIAVLRYDDRGIGGSTGASAQDTTADFATDAEAALAFLLARDDIGGFIAQQVAAQMPAYQGWMCRSTPSRISRRWKRSWPKAATRTSPS